MNPISNSVVKEQFRQRNEDTARNKESQIRAQLNNDISQLKNKPNYKGTVFFILGAVAGIAIAAGGGGWVGFIIGVGLGLAVWGAANYSVANFNKKIASQKQSLNDDAERRIREAYSQADQQTVREISAYEREVEQYSQRILGKRESITPMVDSAVNMFKRMISHADSGSNIRFIQCDFTYQVTTTGICYSYQSRYSNPQDDFNFNKQRYKDLSMASECEGLAQALAKLVIMRMKNAYPPNSMNITVEHMDAQVTMHFKGANKNFVPARDIL